VPAPKERDFELTRRRLGEWLAARLPGARELRVSELSGPGTTGFSSDTLLFDLAWNEAGQAHERSLVLRLEPRGFPIFPVYDVGRQFRVQKLLGETDVPVPGMLWLEEDETPLGARFYVMEQARGQVPSDNPTYHQDGWMKQASPEQRAQVWRSGIEVLTRIHRVDWQAPGYAFLGESAGGTPHSQHLARYERYLAWAARGRAQPTCEAALAWLQREQPRESEPVALCWGDSRLGNMMFREGRCVAVLDWELATLGNPEQDLGWWIFLDHHHSGGIGVERLEGLPGREETIAQYEEATGHRVRHLAYYEAFAAFRFAVIMIRVAQQLAEYGLLPEDSTFETDNTCTRALAQMLDLPPPCEA
jgi:aminoglycoside phosphotransferase (APT) family kinase protein